MTKFNATPNVKSLPEMFSRLRSSDNSIIKKPYPPSRTCFLLTENGLFSETHVNSAADFEQESLFWSKVRHFTFSLAFDSMESILLCEKTDVRLNGASSMIL